jgi:magnesium chelatase family protein
MVSRIKTVAFVGMRPSEITVEAQISPGIAAFCIVGLPDKTVGESKERIRSTFYQLGIGFPAKKVIVNMAPADVPKGGSHYDLPIALAILGAMEAIDINLFENTIAIGELGLDGSLCHVSGAICAAMLANENDMSLICPKACEGEAAWSGNDGIIACHNITTVINHFSGVSQVAKTEISSKHMQNLHEYDVDMSDVYGQLFAKRAFEIAASGGHNVLMIGSPGSGKSMLAARMKTILPPLYPMEALETTCIYSIAGMTPNDGLIRLPPFRDPHHSASLISIVGGGPDAKPGELSLAHNGILFLDELPEFHRQTIDALRQPLETNSITVARAKEHITYPANIYLIAAMNPCKCGFYGVPQKQCQKIPRCANDYKNKISGPILDRFDVIIYVNSIKTAELFENEERETSAIIRKRVTRAREIQINRANEYDVTDLKLNGKAKGKYLNEMIKLEKSTSAFFQQVVQNSNISARGCHKILRVARTIADLDESKIIQKHHVAEATQYKLLNIH